MCVCVRVHPRFDTQAGGTWFRLGDEVRSESADVLALLARRCGISMFTGDASREAGILGETLGIGDTITGMLPDEKVLAIRQRQQAGDLLGPARQGVGKGVGQSLQQLEDAEVGVAHLLSHQHLTAVLL